MPGSDVVNDNSKSGGEEDAGGSEIDGTTFVTYSKESPLPAEGGGCDNPVPPRQPRQRDECKEVESGKEQDRADEDDDDDDDDRSGVNTTVEESLPGGTEATAEDTDDDGSAYEKKECNAKKDGEGRGSEKQWMSFEIGEDDDVDDDFYADIGFVLEGMGQPSRTERFRWVTPCTGRDVIVTLNVADDEPGAVQSGHYLWPGARYLAEYLVSQERGQEEHSGNIDDLGPAAPVVSVLELGAGCSLASLAALQLYQETLQCIVITDQDPGTLERSRDNHETTLEAIINHADINHDDDELNAAINTIANIPVSFEALGWTTDPEDYGLDCCRAALSEHTTSPERRHFDLVLGSDLVYDASVVDPLLSTAYFLMKPPAANSNRDGGGADIEPPPPQSRFILSQSFAYDSEIEEEIDRVCDRLGLQRTVLVDDNDNSSHPNTADDECSSGRSFVRIQEFRCKEDRN